LKEILAQHGEKYRGRLMDLCIRYIPDEIDFIDSIVLILILSKIGILKINEENFAIDFDEHSYVKTADISILVLWSL
jgi:hypothetical protein